MTEYLKATGINYSGTLAKVKKKNDDYLQPIYEAFTNSLEAIKILKKRSDFSGKGKIQIKIFVTKGMPGYDFPKIEIIDNGIGFDDTEFKRLRDLNDQSKGFSNQGTGRVQFLHTFDETKIVSNYRDKKSLGKFKKRIFTISKSNKFLKENAIICLENGNEEDVQEENSYTSLTFKGFLLDRDRQSFQTLTCEKLKENIIEHYLDYFCGNITKLPEIVITKIVNDNTNINDTLKIISTDIPKVDKEQDIDINYSIIANDGEIKAIDKTERLKLKAFKISQNKLNENKLKFVSKGEIAQSISLDHLFPDEQIENNRYLFLLSGEYINTRDSDTRGEIRILNKEDFNKKDKGLFDTKEILLEDIEQKTNDTIIKMYDEINDKYEGHKQKIEELRRMFLLNPNTLDSLRKKLKFNDSDDDILKKVYKADAEIIAKKDAKIKERIKALDELDTTDKKAYNEKLQTEVNKLVGAIPLQNRTALTSYVARRKLVLELFEKIISNELIIQKNSKRDINEKLLHNLIFQQTSDKAENSDLWLVNEDFIYFKGTSDRELGKISLDNKSIIQNNLSQEQEGYRLKQEGDAKRKRPDILLFPEEGKCIIIEFKSPNVNASDHLTQINKYASLINNLSKSEYEFTTYYGYLIGENIDIDDIQDNDSDFVSAQHFDFIYRQYKRIIGKFGKNDGSLYTEIIKYSTLLDRALNRNSIFINKIS